MNLKHNGIPRVVLSLLLTAVALLSGVGIAALLLAGAGSQAQAVQPSAVPTAFPAVSLFKDINPGPGSSAPYNLTSVGDTLFFGADDGSSGKEMWRSDGTQAGTVLVKDIRPGVHGSSPGGFTYFSGALFFGARDDSTGGSHLWKSDGTEAGTVLFLEGVEVGSLIAVGNVLFFEAGPGSHAFELWKSDGTITGTGMITDIRPGPWGSNIENLIDVDGTLFFTAEPNSSQVLYKSDGTVTGTVPITDVSIPSYESTANVDGVLFFSNGSRELWKSDGTVTGTVMVKDVFSGTVFPKSLKNLVNVSGTLFFAANDGVHGKELWKSDGTLTGTVMVKDINTLSICDSSDRPGWGSLPCGSKPGGLTNVDGTLFFGASDGVHGWELWKSDGTVTGTVMVKDINTFITCDLYGAYPGTGSSACSSFPNGFVCFDHKLVFLASDSGSEGFNQDRYEPWVSDGHYAWRRRFVSSRRHRVQW
jgi:ELWxxDGT repeat protein